VEWFLACTDCSRARGTCAALGRRQVLRERSRERVRCIARSNSQSLGVARYAVGLVDPRATRRGRERIMSRARMRESKFGRELLHTFLAASPPPRSARTLRSALPLFRASSMPSSREICGSLLFASGWTADCGDGLARLRRTNSLVGRRARIEDAATRVALVEVRRTRRLGLTDDRIPIVGLPRAGASVCVRLCVDAGVRNP